MKKINFLNLIFSILLSISIHLGITIEKNVDFFIKDFHVNGIFVLKVILLSGFIYFLLKGLFFLFDKIPLSKKEFVLNKKKIFLIFLGIFFTGMLYLLVFYPAVCLNDTLFMLYGPLYRGNPIIYAIFMSLLFLSLKVLVGSTVAIFIMSAIQVFLASIILTYVVVWFYRTFHYRILTIVLILYYAFLPIVTCYNVALNKDGIFSLVVLLFFVFLYKIVESKGKILTKKKFLFDLLFVSCFVMYIRNNGFLLIFPTLIVVCIIYGFQKYRKQSIILLTFILLLSFVPGVVLNLLHVDSFKREWYAVPIQQVCYVVKYHPDRLTDADYEILSKFIKDPQKTISNNYDVYTVDSIKFLKSFNYKKFDQYSKEFLLLWIRKFPNNISSYIKSYLLNSYDMWFVRELDKSQSVFFTVSNFGVLKNKRIYQKRLFPSMIQKKLTSFYNLSTTYLNPAGCFVLLIIIILYALERKKKEVLILSSPLLFLWFTLMLASPYSSALRYMAPYIYILPIIMLYTFIITRKDDENGLSRKSKKKFFKERRKS